MTLQTPVEHSLPQPATEHSPLRTNRRPIADHPQVLSLKTDYSPQMIICRQTQHLAVVSRMHCLLSWLVTIGRVEPLDVPFTTPPRARFQKKTPLGGVSRWRSLSHQNER